MSFFDYDERLSTFANRLFKLKENELSEEAEQQLDSRFKAKLKKKSKKDRNKNKSKKYLNDGRKEN